MAGPLRAVMAAALLLPCALLALAQAPPEPPAKPEAPPSADLPLAVAYSTEADGYLTPCGCSDPMLGGFPRRASWLKAQEKQAALVRVDNGDLTRAMGRQDELKAETLAEMFDTLRYDALGLGEKDFRLGLPYLQALQARSKGAMLCANARLADGAPALKEYVIVTRRVAGGATARVFVTAVLSDRFAPEVTAVNPDVTLEPPAAALERLKADMAARADVRVLLYHGPKAEAEQIARDFPLFQLVVCAHEGDHPLDPARAGNATLVCSGQDGKYVGLARFAAEGGAWRVTEVRQPALGPELADDPAMLRIKTAYLDRVAAEDLLGKTPRTPAPNGDTYAGSAACASCHAAAHATWLKSGHARALETLERVKQARDPECVLCHVVGLDRQGGFASREKTPDLASVGCESCHGAAAKHAKSPASAPMPKVGSAACLGCHNPQNSPKFDFDAYWPRIRH